MGTAVKLFVDDERPVPDHTWVLAQRSRDAIDILTMCKASGSTLDVLSLDHDLSTVIAEDDTARPIMLWMCENEWWPTDLYVHTANPYGEEWLVGMARRYGPAGVLKGYGINFWGS